MSEGLKRDRVKQCIQGILAAVAERFQAEAELAKVHPNGRGSSDAGLQHQLASLNMEFADRHRALDDQYQAERFGVLNGSETELAQASDDHQLQLANIEAEYETHREAARAEQSEARWMANSMLDDKSESSPKFQFASLSKRLTLQRERLAQQRTQAEQSGSTLHALLVRRRQWREFAISPADENAGGLEKSFDTFQTAVDEIRSDSSQLSKQLLPRLFVGSVPFVLLCVLATSLFLALWFQFNPAWLGIAAEPQSWEWAKLAAVTAAGAAMGVMGLLFAVARARSGPLLSNVQQATSDLRASHQHWLHAANVELQKQKRACKKQYDEMVADRGRILEKIDARASRRLAPIVEWRQQARDDNEKAFISYCAELIRARDQRLREIDQTYSRAVAALSDERSTQLETAGLQHAEQQTQQAAQEAAMRTALADSWQQSLSAFVEAIAEIERDTLREQADWQTIAAHDSKLPEALPNSIRVGTYQLDFEHIIGGLSQNGISLPDRRLFDLPLLLPFPGQTSLLLKGCGGELDVSAKALRSVMLRLLTSMPAGKVRFTIIDPVGLGEDFSGFMNLTEYSEQFVGRRIWTQSSHIEKRLTEISEHMEDVFQAYLRNEFDSIEEYNQHAGEVAEPYHFVVVANFPANFSEAAVRRLVSIAAKGPKCGVYTLMSVDTKQPLPHGFDLAELESSATTLDWVGERFASNDPEWSWLPIAVDPPPNSSVLNEIVHAVGRQSKNARRVEVAFDRIAPPADQVWTRQSRDGLDVPLGRAGATKLQHLRLGHGTSQHVLVAGKTGSGKSSLVHALVTNVALNYSPAEVEFYLIDFKKGVEFKTYASNALPHARVIGIESDREFGVSVLERLDDVLKERGELFRQYGVQDIASYRKLRSSDRMPRILLVVDEFQEFFVQDDALAQSATLLLDRLVRQGRAFGIHVVLGSQTLGGAYSLARSTLGQVAVRIALQCSESDAHLILSEENTAARLLSRPGEAIYNDANGLLEGNHPFQVAWLPDDSRDEHLRSLRDRAVNDSYTAESAVVFEGNVPSDPRRNSQLVQTIAGCRELPFERTNRRRPICWPGESVSIKAPPSIQFERRPGDNLLVVGQEEVSVRGLLSVMFLTLAAQQETSDSSSPLFYILDEDSGPSDGLMSWASLAELSPQRTNVACGQDVAATLDQVAEIVRRRSDGSTADDGNIFLVVSNLSRIRALRNNDDDYGFSSGDEAQTPANIFAEVLRDGPSVGVHCICWCDSYINLGRWLNSRAQAHFNLRIAFQMNPTDSSSLIDSPAASRMGRNRAILYDRQNGHAEKFRPYTVPSQDWLNWVRARLLDSTLSHSATLSAIK